MHFAWDPYPYQQDVLDAVLLHGKRRIAWIAGRRVGKTEGVANLVLQLAVKRKGIDIVIFAPSLRQARVLSCKIRYMLAGSSWEGHTTVDNVGELRLSFGTDEDGKPVESTIYTMSLSGKARGEGADVLVIDESAFCDGEDYRNKALPFVVDREGEVIVHISTVWSEDDHFMKAYERYQELEHGATFRTATRDKPGVSEAILEEFRAEMLESEFMREYECKLVPTGGVFNREALQACLADYELLGVNEVGRVEPRARELYAVGVDWGKHQDQTVIAAIKQDVRKERAPARLILLEAYEPNPEDDKHYTTILQDVVRVAEHLGALKVVADEGEGAHQAEVLKAKLGNRFEPFRFTGASRDFLVDNARYLVEEGLVELPVEPERVRRAFLNVESTRNGYEIPSHEPKDIFDGIALALSEVKSGRRRAGMDVMTAKYRGGEGFGGWDAPRAHRL